LYASIIVATQTLNLIVEIRRKSDVDTSISTKKDLKPRSVDKPEERGDLFDDQVAIVVRKNVLFNTININILVPLQTDTCSDSILPVDDDNIAASGHQGAVV